MNTNIFSTNSENAVNTNTARDAQNNANTSVFWRQNKKHSKLQHLWRVDHTKCWYLHSFCNLFLLWWTPNFKKCERNLAQKCCKLQHLVRCLCSILNERCFHMFLAFLDKKRRHRLKLDDSVARKKAGGRRREDSTQENMMMKLLHTQGLLHRKVFTLYTERLLDTEAFASWPNIASRWPNMARKLGPHPSWGYIAPRWANGQRSTKTGQHSP